MKKILLGITLFASLTFSSCSSDDKKTVSTGISTGNYWPMAINNSWNFFGHGATSEIKIVSNKVVEGKTYYEVKDNANTDYDIKSWLAKDGAVYYQKTDETTVNENGTLITLQGYEIPIFRDDLEMNDSWNGTVKQKISYLINGKTTRVTGKLEYKGTILATNSTEIINDVTYTDVIKMSMKMTVTIQNQTSEAWVEYWFAKDIGPIKTYEVGANIGIDRELVTYNLN